MIPVPHSPGVASEHSRLGALANMRYAHEGNCITNIDVFTVLISLSRLNGFSRTGLRCESALRSLIGADKPALTAVTAHSPILASRLPPKHIQESNDMLNLISEQALATIVREVKHAISNLFPANVKPQRLGK